MVEGDWHRWMGMIVMSVVVSMPVFEKEIGSAI